MNRFRNYGIVITIGLLVMFAGCRNSLEKRTEANSPHLRHIALEGQSNFRDIGGYKTTEGLTVK